MRASPGCWACTEHMFVDGDCPRSHMLVPPGVLFGLGRCIFRLTISGHRGVMCVFANEEVSVNALD